MRKTDGTEISVADAALLIATTVHDRGAAGVLGQAELARIVGLSQRMVGILMPRATRVAADLYPGETLRLRPEGARAYRYGVTDDVTSPEWFAMTLRRQAKAITAWERSINEVRGLPHPDLRSSTAILDAASTSMRAAAGFLATVIAGMR